MMVIPIRNEGRPDLSNGGTFRYAGVRILREHVGVFTTPTVLL